MKDKWERKETSKQTKQKQTKNKQHKTNKQTKNPTYCLGITISHCQTDAQPVPELT